MFIGLLLLSFEFWLIDLFLCYFFPPNILYISKASCCVFPPTNLFTYSMITSNICRTVSASKVSSSFFAKNGTSFFVFSFKSLIIGHQQSHHMQKSFYFAFMQTLVNFCRLFYPSQASICLRKSERSIVALRFFAISLRY